MDAQPFSDTEGLRIAAEIEKRGYTFHSRAMRFARSEAVVALLKRLADDERAHHREFLRLYEEAGTRREKEEEYGEEISAYFSAIASDIVFQGGLTALGREDGFDDPVKILLQGIQSEKDSLLFYAEMIKNAKDDAVRESFREVVRQEVAHLKELTAAMEPHI